MQRLMVTCRIDGERLHADTVYGQDKQHNGPFWKTCTHKFQCQSTVDAPTVDRIL